MENNNISLIISIFSIIIIICLITIFSPLLKGAENTIDYQVEKVNEVTNYEIRKEVEDTCRAYIASYEADGITWLTMQNSEKAIDIETANAAKLRANRTAAIYNEYYLKNSYVWKDNVPNDIRTKLEYIE